MSRSNQLTAMLLVAGGLTMASGPANAAGQCFGAHPATGPTVLAKFHADQEARDARAKERAERKAARAAAAAEARASENSTEPREAFASDSCHPH